MGNVDAAYRSRRPRRARMTGLRQPGVVSIFNGSTSLLLCQILISSVENWLCCVFSYVLFERRGHPFEARDTSYWHDKDAPFPWARGYDANFNRGRQPLSDEAVF